jgi:predicted DNA-binding protein
MNIRLKPETESRLKELASRSGRPADELVEDALAGYLAEAAELGDLLDSRSDDIKSGRVKALEGETFFEGLRQREEIRKRLEKPRASAASASLTCCRGACRAGQALICHLIPRRFSRSAENACFSSGVSG